MLLHSIDVNIGDEEEVINFFDVNSSYYPHGMDMDTEGNLWMAAYKSGTVYKIDSEYTFLLLFFN